MWGLDFIETAFRNMNDIYKYESTDVCCYSILLSFFSVCLFNSVCVFVFRFTKLTDVRQNAGFFHEKEI